MEILFLIGITVFAGTLGGKICQKWKIPQVASFVIVGQSLCLLFCFAITGCDSVYRMLDKEGAEEKELIGEIIPHEKNEYVEEVQALLHLYGYNPGKVDGVLGFRTRNTLEEFQSDIGIKPSRFIDKATWEKLNLFKDNGLIVDRQLDIKLIQALLKASGHDPGGIDGKFGERTKSAVRSFQKANGLKVDGKIGYQTMSKLTEFMDDIPAEN